MSEDGDAILIFKFSPWIEDFLESRFIFLIFNHH